MMMIGIGIPISQARMPFIVVVPPPGLSRGSTPVIRGGSRRLLHAAAAGAEGFNRKSIGDVSYYDNIRVYSFRIS